MARSSCPQMGCYKQWIVKILGHFGGACHLFTGPAKLLWLIKISCKNYTMVNKNCYFRKKIGLCYTTQL